MKLLIVICFLFLQQVFPPPVTAQQLNQHLIAYSSTSFITASSTGVEDEYFLREVFYPDTVPSAGIKVFENALGNLIQDAFIDISDLLRLRDIIIGRAPAPGEYEIAKGDLIDDGIIDKKDLDYMRDILLHRSPVPYRIGSAGGQVTGDGITLTIPEGAIDSDLIIAVREIPPSEFQEENDIDIKAGEQEEIYYMSSFEIISDKTDFKLPVGAEIKLDSMPPCAYEGLNGLFAAVPDKDGDGRSELFLINELQAKDSLTLITADIPIPQIGSLSSPSLEPGQTLTISGNNFGEEVSNIIVRIVNKSDTAISQNVIPFSVEETKIIITVPIVPAGEYNLDLLDLRSGITSNMLGFVVTGQNYPTDIRSIILNYLTAIDLDSADADILYGEIEDENVRGYYTNSFKTTVSDLAEEILTFTNMDDSLMQSYSKLAAYLQKLSPELPQNSIQSAIADCDFCKPLESVEWEIYKLYKQYLGFYWAAMAECLGRKKDNDCIFCNVSDEYRKKILRLTDQLSALRTAYHKCFCQYCPDESGECRRCENATYIGFGPKSAKISGGYGGTGGGFSAKGTCLNIIKYQSNQCINIPAVRVKGGGSPVPLSRPPELKCPSGSLEKNILFSEEYEVTIPNPGSLIKAVNVQVPYNIVAIVNDNGNAFIPHVPMNTKVTYSMYDPVSGLYDPDAGTYTTGSEPGGFDRPILLFQPSTETRQVKISIGEIKHDSVNAELSRIFYLLNIDPADTGSYVNIGFSSAVSLGFRLEDPFGSIIFDEPDAACYSVLRMKFSKPGIYKFRAAMAAGMLPGSFALGISYSPDSPLPYNCLCGNTLKDTLYEELSPYQLTCPAVIESGDTLFIEPDVTLEFPSGTIISSYGVIRGTGTPDKPIRIKQKSEYSLIGPIISNAGIRRKEGEQ